MTGKQATGTGVPSAGDRPLHGNSPPVRTFLLWAALAALFALNYAWTFRDLAGGWIRNDRLVLGLLVLAGAAFLAWDRRDELARARLKPSRWGLLFLGASFLLLFVGTRSSLVFAGGMSSVFLRGVSAVAFLCGSVLLLCGRRFMRPLWLPALLLLFIYPENFFTSYWAPLRLQTLAAVISERVVGLFGSVVVREGHVLEAPNFSANVEEACSGIRSLITVVPTAIFVAGCTLRKPAAKAALIVLAVPLTIAANVLRVTGTVMLGIYVGERAAEGFFHYFAGLGIFLVCLAGLLLIARVLRVADSEPDGTGGGAAPRSGEPADAPRHPLRPAGAKFAAMGAVLLLGVAYQGTELYLQTARSAEYASAPLSRMPKDLARWQGRELPVDFEAIIQRHWTDYLYREYRRAGDPPIQALALYWKRGSGTLIGRRTHPAESCYPYHGMKRLWSETTRAETGSDLFPEVSLSSNVFSNGRRTLLVTTWHRPLRPGDNPPVPHDYLGRMIYGMKELFRLGGTYPAELAFQLITPLRGDTDRIVSAHRSFARRFIPALVACARGPQKEGSRKVPAVPTAARMQAAESGHPSRAPRD